MTPQEESKPQTSRVTTVDIHDKFVIRTSVTCHKVPVAFDSVCLPGCPRIALLQILLFCMHWMQSTCKIGSWLTVFDCMSRVNIDQLALVERLWKFYFKLQLALTECQFLQGQRILCTRKINFCITLWHKQIFKNKFCTYHPLKLLLLAKTVGVQLHRLDKRILMNSRTINSPLNLAMACSWRDLGSCPWLCSLCFAWKSENTFLLWSLWQLQSFLKTSCLLQVKFKQPITPGRLFTSQSWVNVSVVERNLTLGTGEAGSPSSECLQFEWQTLNLLFSNQIKEPFTLHFWALPW